MCKVFTSCLGTAAVWFVDVNRYCSFWVGVGGVMMGLGGSLGVGGLSPMKMMSGLVDLGGSEEMTLNIRIDTGDDIRINDK